MVAGRSVAGRSVVGRMCGVRLPAAAVMGVMSLYVEGALAVPYRIGLPIEHQTGKPFRAGTIVRRWLRCSGRWRCWAGDLASGSASKTGYATLRIYDK